MSAERGAAGTCPKCGEEIRAKNRTFCPNCGVNMLEYAASHKEASGTTPDTSHKREIPDQPAEVLKELLRETRYLAQLTEKARLEQKESAASQLQTLQRIKTATDVWLLLVILGVIVGCLVGSGIL